MISRGRPHFGGLYVDEFQRQTPFLGLYVDEFQRRTPFLGLYVDEFQRRTPHFERGSASRYNFLEQCWYIFSFLISGACFCCDSCYPNWTQTITIWHQNRFIGKVLEVPVCCSRKKLEVWDKNGTNMYNITSKCCPMSCGPAVYFPVISSNYINYDSYSLAVVQSNPSWLGDI